MTSSKLHFHRSARLAAVLLTTASALLLCTSEAQARERNTVITGPNGQTVTRNVTRDHGDVSATTSGPNGRWVTRTVDRSAAGTTATITGSGGKTATRVVTRQP